MKFLILQWMIVPGITKLVKPKSRPSISKSDVRFIKKTQLIFKIS